MRARRARTVLILATAMAIGASGSAPAATKPIKIRLKVPAPGGVTLGVAGRSAPAGPRKRAVRLVVRRSLPPSVRILAITRRFRSNGRRRVASMILIVNRKTAAAPRRAPSEEVGLTGNPFAYMAYLVTGIDATEAPDFIERNPSSAVLENAQNATPVQEQKLAKSAHDLFSGKANENNRVDFGSLNVETGHYDDGHAFGWNVSERKLWNDVLSDVTNRNLDRLVADIENDADVDLDGNSKVDEPPPLAPTGTGDTCKGSFTSPVHQVTLPEQGSEQNEYFETPIPLGCSSLATNIEVLDAGDVVAWNYTDPPPGAQESSTGEAGPAPGPPDGAVHNRCFVYSPFLRNPPGSTSKNDFVAVKYQSFGPAGTQASLSIRISWHPR